MVEARTGGQLRLFRCDLFEILRRRTKTLIVIPKTFPATNLSHQPVRPGALLVFEDDVGVVVGDQRPERLVLSADGTLGQAAGRQGLLGEVWLVLFINERKDFSGPSPPQRAPAWTTGQAEQGGGEEEDEVGDIHGEAAEGEEDGEEHQSVAGRGSSWPSLVRVMAVYLPALPSSRPARQHCLEQEQGNYPSHGAECSDPRKLASKSLSRRCPRCCGRFAAVIE